MVNFADMKTVLIAVLILLSLDTFSQGKVLRHELRVESDNDAYTLNLTRDQYYTNGLIIAYRVLSDSSKWKSSFEKVINSFNLNHRIYSPRHLHWSDSADMDRPYAGQMSLSYSREYFFKNNSHFKGEVEVGMMGPSLRIAQLQYEWHKAFGMQLPQGWKYQINDAPIVNVWAKYAKTLTEFKSVDIISESNFTGGTAFTHLRQEFMVRLGNIKPISSSTQYNGVTGITNNGPGQQEIYFFISPGVEYVFYNSTIQGTDIGKESIFTKTAEKWVYQTRAGFMMSWTKFDFALIYYRRTRETPESQFHKYMGIRLNQRF